MKKNLRSKILLCVLAGGVLAANTALAAEYTEYTEAILGAEDTGNIYNSIKSNTGNNYTYTFTEDSVIKISGGEYGIAIGTNAINTDSITVAGANLNIDIVNKQITTDANGYGISIGAGQQNKIIDMSNNNGYINVSTESGGTYANSYGAVLLNGAGSSNNEIHIGDTVMDLYANNNANGRATAAGIYIIAGTSQTITMGDGQIKAKAVSENNGAEAFGIIDNTNNGNIQIGDVSMNISAEGNNSPSWAIGSVGIMKFYTGFVKAGDGDMIVTAKLSGAGDVVYANGIQAYQGTVEKGAGDIIVKAIATENSNAASVQGIFAENGAEVTKGNGNITAIAQGGKYTTAYGVNAVDSTVNLGIVDINAEAVDSGNNDPFAAGIYAGGNNAKVNMHGGSISTKVGERWKGDQYALYTYDGASVKVNENGGNDVVINGDIYNIDGSVYLNLDTANSVLTGAVQTDGGEITLNLKNGATWNQVFDYDSVITNLNMDNGIIKVDDVGNSNSITIDNYSGNGEIVLTVGDSTSNGDIDVIAGRTYITSADEGSVINMSVNNNNFIGTTDSAQALANLNQIANEISYDDNDGHITGKVTIKEGLIMPEASGDLLFDQNDIGYVANVKQNSSTTTIDNIKNIAATAIVAWRQEDSTLSQRLGELRESDGGQGIWVRMSRGEFEYDGEYKNQYNFFQMGYDWAAGNWHYGAAVSHNDGQTTYTHGDGENRSTSLSLYGTWLGDKGHYADIVLKQGRLSNDFDIYTEAGHTSGDYDAWGTSLSGEYGMKVDLDGGWYVTPQAQLTLMRIGGEDYTTNNGIKVNQDSLESAVGRVGFEVGKRISDSGSIYAKASLLHDFAGSADTYLSLNGLINSYHQDIGDTWCEAGIGFNYKTSENSYVYADIVKTFGGDVETPWQWNAGMRWTF